MEFPLVLDRALQLYKFNACVRYPNLAGKGTVKAGERKTSSYEILASQKLVKDLETHGIANELYPGKILVGPRLRVAFTFHGAVPPEDYENDRIWPAHILDQGFLRISGLDKIASSLGTRDGFDAKIRVDIEHLVDTIHYDDDDDCVSIKPLPTSSTYIFPLTQNGPSYRSLDVEKYTGEGLIFQEMDWLEDCDWEIPVSLTLLCSPIAGLDPEIPYPYQLEYVNKMLSEEILADLTIVTENGSEIKAHRSVLAAHSSVFRAMFQSGMLEAQTGILELEGISEQSVRALREFLYVWKGTSAEKNSDICVHLLEAGHKYDIPPLEHCMKHILLRKPNEWYTPDAVLHLATFTKNIQHEELQKRAFELLKAIQNKVETLPEFRKLCEENEKSEKELFQYLTTI